MSRFVTVVLVLASVAALAARPAERRSAPRDGFEASVSGALTAELSGRARFGVGGAGPGSGSGLTIELEADRDGGTLLVQWPASSAPGPGTYPVSRTPVPGSVGVLFAPGPALGAQGAMRGERGSVLIRHARAGRLTGTFALRMDGVQVSGSFTAIEVTPQFHTTH